MSSRYKVRDPQDTILVLSLVALAIFCVIARVEYASQVVIGVMGIAAAKLGTTGARPGGPDA